MNALVAFLLSRSPLQWLFRRRAAGQLAVLAYHSVDDPPQFQAHMEELARHHHPVTPSQVAEGRLPQKAVLVTFDDGDRTVFEQGLPVLRRLGIPAAAYVVSGLVDTSEALWWRRARAGGESVAELKRVPDSERRRRLELLPELQQAQLTSEELREMAAGGITVGNHTHTHPCLDYCDAEVLNVEIARAHERLTEILGQAPTTFAYPNGNRDPRAEQSLAELGYRTAFLFDHHLSPRRPANPLAISRLRISSTASMDRFRLILSGLHPWLMGWRDQLQSASRQAPS